MCVLGRVWVQDIAWSIACARTKSSLREMRIGSVRQKKLFLPLSHMLVWEEENKLSGIVLCCLHTHANGALIWHDRLWNIMLRRWGIGLFACLLARDGYAARWRVLYYCKIRVTYISSPPPKGSPKGFIGPSSLQGPPEIYERFYLK